METLPSSTYHGDVNVTLRLQTGLRKDQGHFIDLIALLPLLEQNTHKKDPQLVFTVPNIFLLNLTSFILNAHERHVASGSNLGQ